MLTKPAWNHLEIRTMRGVLSTLMREPGVPPPPRARPVAKAEDESGNTGD